VVQGEPAHSAHGPMVECPEHVNIYRYMHMAFPTRGSHLRGPLLSHALPENIRGAWALGPGAWILDSLVSSFFGVCRLGGTAQRKLNTEYRPVPAR
jgi:hypothetical protein